MDIKSMRVIKLTTEYIGNYGVNIYESILFPQEVEGVLFPKFEEGTYLNTVWLGEIEGKHSQCYGDLIVEKFKVNQLPDDLIHELIETASSLNHFEHYIERLASDYWEEIVETGSEIMNVESEVKLLMKWKAYDYKDLPKALLLQLKEEYSAIYKLLKIKDDDYKLLEKFMIENKMQFSLLE